MHQDNKKPIGRSNGMIWQIALSVIGIVLSALLLFVPEIEPRTLCYILCGVLVAGGVAAVIAFFLREGYRRLRDYRFALGILLLILGCCGLLRIEEMAEAFTFYMGLTALILSVMILQGTVQLWVLKNRLWILNLILTILTLAGSTLVLANTTALFEKIPGFACWVLLITGGAGLISLLFTFLGVRGADRAPASPEQTGSAGEYPEGPAR